MSKVLIPDANRDQIRLLHEGGSDYYGSSDVCSIVGLNPYHSPLDEWCVRTGKIKREDISHKIAVKRGIFMEPFIGQLFRDEKSGSIVKNDSVYQHERIGFAVATPDFFWQALDQDKVAIVEAKCYDHWARKEFEDGGACDQAHTQLQWQLGVLGDFEEGYIAALIGNDFYTPVFKREPAVFDQLVTLVDKFRDCVKRDIPPMAGPGDKALIETLTNPTEGISTSLEESASYVSRYLELKKLLAEQAETRRPLEKEVEALKNTIRLKLGDATCGRCGDVLVTLQKVERKAQEATSYWKLNIK